MQQESLREKTTTIIVNFAAVTVLCNDKYLCEATKKPELPKKRKSIILVYVRVFILVFARLK